MESRDQKALGWAAGLLVVCRLLSSKPLMRRSSSSFLVQRGNRSSNDVLSDQTSSEEGSHNTEESPTMGILPQDLIEVANGNALSPERQMDILNSLTPQKFIDLLTPQFHLSPNQTATLQTVVLVSN